MNKMKVQCGFQATRHAFGVDWEGRGERSQINKDKILSGNGEISKINRKTCMSEFTIGKHLDLSYLYNSHPLRDIFP